MHRRLKIKKREKTKALFSKNSAPLKIATPRGSPLYQADKDVSCARGYP